MRGLVRIFYRKGNSVKRPGPFSEPPDSKNCKSCCPHPLPENQLLHPLSLFRRRGNLGGICIKRQFLGVKFSGPFLAGNCAEKPLLWVPI